jgi:3-oxoacyl-[acyl-carrier-protein] synthase II
MLYRGITQLSPSADLPEQACRPFDARRDGTVRGEGAAAFVLECEDHARARGATILARVTGWGESFGSTNTPRHLPRQAIVRSIEKALHMSGLTAGELGHVNAHAAGLVEDDAIEGQAIQSALGDVPVTAPKSFFGTTGSGGAAIDMIASVLALMHGEIPVTLNYQQPDPNCPVNVVHGTPQPAHYSTAIVLSQSATGQAVAITLQRD